MLFQKLKSFVNEHHLFTKDDKVLLTVSGGIDSMVMMRLFHRLGINCSVAHCNFQLRGEESDGDEAFVREKAKDLNFPVFVTRFETMEYADENQLSVQMAARELRYTWFEKLAKVHHFQWIAVAHNRDDSMETFFINLGRGSGISGLTGISAVSGNIIRPLLFASRAEIAVYAEKNVVKFREDSSNSSDKYLRNYIRHQVIPEFEEVFPKFRETLFQTLGKLSDANEIYRFAIQGLISAMVSSSGKLVEISIPLLKAAPAPKTILFELLKNYGFTSAVIDDIFHSTGSISGKIFFSSTHVVVKDRDKLIVSVTQDVETSRYYIEKDIPCITVPIGLKFERIDRTSGFTISRDACHAFLDYDKLSFPLILRKWQQGDYFIPLGMKGMKKISDFFVDQKLSLIDKQNTWILTSADQIVWIAGHRIDDRFKLTDSSGRILKVTLIASSH
jgi:tRNA(Ile)-lysidine synthase